MTRSIAIPAAALWALTLACGGKSPPEARPPAASAASSAPADPNAPPMYKPSSRSPAPVPITDPSYGASPLAPSAPGLGVTLGDFEVALADGGTFSLAEARRAGPVLVMFYRGFW